MSTNPIPDNEKERLLSLGNLNLDYTDLEAHFKDIIALTSRISGMDVSLINLIDPFTQWTIAGNGTDVYSMPREESVCQYTIMHDKPLEVQDMASDDRFRDRSYVAGPPGLKYYFGLPLTTTQGVHIGSLCVLDPKPKRIDPNNIEILKLLADEIVNKLKSYHTIARLKEELSQSLKKQKKIAQDVRDPLSGIIGISEILSEQPGESRAEALEYMNLINESSKLILNITDSVLIDDPEEKDQPIEKFNISILETKLRQLYQPLAANKNIKLDFVSESYKAYFPIPKSEVLQIAGTLISSAINLLPSGETLTIELDVKVEPDRSTLNIDLSGSAIPNAFSDSTFHKQVIGLTRDLVHKLNGSLDQSSSEELVGYRLSLPFTT